MASCKKHYHFYKINSKRDATQDYFEHITCKFLKDFPLIDPDDDLEVILIGEPFTDKHIKSRTKIDLTVRVIDADELDENEVQLLTSTKLENVRSLIRLPVDDKKKRKPEDRKQHLNSVDKSGWTTLLSVANYSVYRQKE